MRRFVRCYRSAGGKFANVQSARRAVAGRREPQISVDMIRSQLGSLPADQRQYLQGVLATREHELTQGLEGSDGPGGGAEPARGNSDPTEGVRTALATAESLDAFDAAFWLAVIRLGTRRRPEDIELLSTVFEVAKQLPDRARRSHYLFRVGTLIYRLRASRFDPINEVEYLDSLVAAGRPFSALRLWRSRAAREDVAGSTYWPEVGALYHLDAGLLGAADSLARSELAAGYVAPRVVAALLRAAARRPRHNSELLAFWTQQLAAQAARGIAPTAAAASVAETDAASILVRRTGVTPEDWRAALAALVGRAQWDLARSLLEAAPASAPIDLPRLAANLRASMLARDGTGDAVAFVAAAVRAAPQILRESALYAAWIAALARRDAPADVQALLAEVTSRGIVLSAADQALIARVLLESGHGTLLPELVGVYPTNTRIAARHAEWVANSETDFDVGSFVDRLDAPLSPAVAHALLRHAEPTPRELLLLGVDHVAWRGIWTRLRAVAVQAAAGQVTDAPSPREAFEDMAASGAFRASAGLIDLVLQTFVRHRDYAGALAVLRYVESRFGQRASLPLLLRTLVLAEAVAKNRPVPLPRARARGEPEAEFDPAETTVPIEQAARLIERQTGASNLLDGESETLSSAWLAVSPSKAPPSPAP